jgi:hypothetical protein
MLLCWKRVDVRRIVGARSAVGGSFSFPLARVSTVVVVNIAVRSIIAARDSRTSGALELERRILAILLMLTLPIGFLTYPLLRLMCNSFQKTTLTTLLHCRFEIRC